MEKKAFKISFFIHVWEKKSDEILLEEFYKDLKGPRWKVLAESYRQKLMQGKEEQAKKQKAALNAVVIAGRCKGGHSASQVKELNGLALFDFDHCPGKLIRMKEKSMTLPYVVASFVSISGEGLKVIVRVDAEDARRYATAYPIVAGELEYELNHPCDMACRDLGRACYASYDPKAYYNPAAEVFPWQDMVPDDARPPCIDPQPGTCFFDTFLNEYNARNPFVAGGRHAFILKLGRVAGYKGFSQEEMELFEKKVVEMYSQSGFGSNEIEKTLMSGYQYANTKKTGEWKPLRGHKAQGSLYSPLWEEDEEEVEDILYGKNEEFRKEAPYFSDEVFEHLPHLLRQGLEIAGNPRERDILLMSMITNISACLPNVSVLYDQKYYSPHLYFLVIAHAGGGKGVASLAGLLPREIQHYYEKQNEEMRLEYDKAFFDWELEQKKALTEKRSPDFSLRPKDPGRKWLMLSPNISKSMLISALEENGKMGCCINATELDMVSGAIQNDSGKHDDVFRAAFQHEVVSADFKVNGRQIVAHSPRLALCLAGTPNQLVHFIPSLENGLYSRFLIYTGHTEWHWRSAAPRDNAEDDHTLFLRLSSQLFELHLFLLKSPTEVTFTAAQWEEHTRRFSSYLSEVVNERDDSPAAIVLRHGLMASRIAGVLTALRKGECAWAMPQYICSDEDFHTAMMITDVMLEHSLLLSTAMTKSNSKLKLIKPYFRLRPVLDAVSKSFTYSELKYQAVLMGIPESTFKRLFKKTIELNIVEKEGDRYLKTRDGWRERGL